MGRGEILDLRGQLRENFPLAMPPAWLEADDAESASAPERVWKVPLLDEAGLVPAQLVEVVCASASGVGPHPPFGGDLLLAGLLAGAAGQGLYAALVDGTDGFDPASFQPEEAERLFARLLWVRCQTVAQVVKSADLLLRDGNLSLVVLDLQANALRELQQQPAHVWYRLRALAEQGRATCVALTPHRSIAAAQLRLDLHDTPSPELLERPRTALVEALQARVTRQRRLETGTTKHGRMAG